jgi:two-component system OmpR family sensor kinase
MALLAAACIGIAGITEFSLYRYLIGELDSQLVQIAQRSAVMESRLPTPTPTPAEETEDANAADAAVRSRPGPEFLDAPGQPIGMVAAVVSNGVPVKSGVLNRGGDRDPLSPRAAGQLAAAGGAQQPVSVNLEGLGRYRVIATNGSNPANRLVIGLDMAAVQQTLARVTLIFTVVTVLALVAAALAGVAIIRRALAPLSRVAAAAGAVADLPLDRGEVALPVRIAEADTNSTTEVGRLGLAVNRMLDHISAALSTRQDSESRVRQFVADASHELRTPLAAIRGYTELAQRQRAQVPADVAHAMARVESEAGRMTNLVEDLLLLARLDSGRPLERAPVDLSRLCADVISDAHAAGPNQHWTLDVPPEPVVVVGDDARLHQVVANLLANARVHTPPGTSVTLALHATTDTAVLRVFDNGPGIDQQLQSEVFERFARGDTSRSSSKGSTGLGLAIVAAVVRAHRGTIAMRSAPGSTTFAVNLPIR